MILHFAGMLFDVRQGAEESLLFAGEEDEANGAARLRGGFDDGVGGAENAAGAKAIISGALTKIPGIEMRANDEDFFGVFAAGNFSDNVGAFDRDRW